MPGVSKKLVYLSTLAAVAMHVVPVGLVQFADYVSDIFVVVELFAHGEEFRGKIALGFMVASVALVFCGNHKHQLRACCCGTRCSSPPHFKTERL